MSNPGAGAALAASFFAFTVAAAQSPADRAFAAEIDSFVTTTVSRSGTPGLAVAVVRGDRPVLVKGYGLADIERKIPVTGQTAYYIASTTKAFTALTLALMAERGTVDLDAPVTRYLRDAQWAPGVNPDSITLRHLLTHTHGLEGNGPVVWRTAYTGVHDNALLKELIRYHSATGSRAYRYTNLGYNIAGLVIDELTRGRWQDALASHVFAPLGMSSTTAYVSRIDSSRRAMPYSTEPTGVRRLDYAKHDANMQAAGGLVSTAEDLAKWLVVQVNRGRLDGRQVVPPRVIAESQRLQATTSERRGDVPIVGYALGWMVGVKGADTVYLHGGGFSAFQTMIAFNPGRRVGVAVMSSERGIGGGMVEAVWQYVLELARDEAAARSTWTARLAELPAMVERTRSGIAADRSRRAARPQTLNRPLEAYAGSYESPAGGVMTWTVRDGRLQAEIGVLRAVAEVFDHQTDRLRVELEPGLGQVAQFKFGESGPATAMVSGGLEYTRR